MNRELLEAAARQWGEVGRSALNWALNRATMQEFGVMRAHREIAADAFKNELQILQLLAGAKPADPQPAEPTTAGNPVRPEGAVS